MAFYSELTIEQNATFSTTVNVYDTQGDAIPLGDYTAAAQMRKSPYSVTATSFIVETTNTVGELILTMDSANTANLSPGRYLYDLNITSNTGIVTRVVEGIVTVTAGITR
jgi:hypothetical protein